MAWKVITFLAIFALSEARPPTSEQRVKIENWLSHIHSHEPKHQEEYASSYPSYEFSYEVSDPHTHDFKGQHEQRKGDDVKGYYWLIQPDGLKRTVKYHADKHSGFKADVEYNKHWEKENERQEGEANQEENNSSESESSEESENGQENENTTRNENEAEGERETESNESGGGEEEEGETEESESQEGEQSELREKHWKRGGYNLDRGNYKRRNNAHGRELKATVGIWQPKYWGKRYRNEETRHVRSNERNENNKENEKHGRSRRGKKGKKEERRQKIQKNGNSEQNEENKKEQKEQQREGNDNTEGSIESNHKDKSLKKSEYHVIIHHPKHKQQ